MNYFIIFEQFNKHCHKPILFYHVLVDGYSRQQVSRLRSSGDCRVLYSERRSKPRMWTSWVRPICVRKFKAGFSQWKKLSSHNTITITGESIINIVYFNLGNPNYKVKWIFSREAMTVFIRFSFRNDASFTFAHIQRVPGSPTQNGTNVSIEFYVEYPGGGTMSQEILILIVSQQLDSIGSNVQLDLGLVTIIVPETPPPPTEDNTGNAVTVVLKDFDADQVCLSDVWGWCLVHTGVFHVVFSLGAYDKICEMHFWHVNFRKKYCSLCSEIFRCYFSLYLSFYPFISFSASSSQCLSFSLFHCLCLSAPLS